MDEPLAVYRPDSISAHPRPDESFAGYVLRLAGLRRLGNWRDLGAAQGMARLTNNPSEETLMAFSAEARIPVEELRAICPGRRNQPQTCYMGFPLPRHAYSFPTRFSRRVCPACLRQNPYNRAVWDILYVNICPVHLNLLIDTCRDCGAGLGWIGAHPARCPCRKGDLSRMAAPDVAPDDASGTATLHGLLGDKRFRNEAAAVRALPPFRDLADPMIVELAIRLGKEACTGRGRFPHGSAMTGTHASTSRSGRGSGSRRDGRTSSSASWTGRLRSICAREAISAR